MTAVALAASLKADNCEIYTDVDGVYTTDPRMVPEARKIDCLSFEDMLEMAGSGAQVMQARSIEVAKKFGVEIHVRSTFTNNHGTIITDEKKCNYGRSAMEEVVVSAVTFDKNQVKLSVIDVPDQPGIAARIFGALAKGGINVDMIIQSAAQDGLNDISFTISRSDLKKAMGVLQKAQKELRARDITGDEKVVKVSIVGVGMRSHAGVAATMFEVLAKAGINIQMISTSEIKVSCIIRENELHKAVAVLHKAFKLGKKK
jgi:aspartate kinase